MHLPTYLSGFAVSFSLILAIGAQNAFVLKQGLKQEFVFVVCLICAISDALFLSAGVFGMGALIGQNTLLLTIAKYGGALFLLWYGFKNFKASLKPSDGLIASGQEVTTLSKVIGLTLAFTWLNPHVYLDTLVFVGGISTKFANKVSFTIGAISASVIWFFGLGYGARILAPIFKQPKAWQILDFLIGVLMWVIAVMLLVG